MPPVETLKQTLTKRSLLFMYKLAGYGSVGGVGDGEPMELRHSEVGWSNRGTIADTAIFFILSEGAVKLGRGGRDERARSIALVTFGFGSAENVLLRSLRSAAARSSPSQRHDVGRAAIELCISCPSLLMLFTAMR